MQYLERSLPARWIATCLVLLVPGVRASAGEGEWIPLTGEGLSAWKQPTGDWFEAADARPDPEKPRFLKGTPGRGVIVNGPEGRTANLYSSETFGDLELHLEFLIPRNSNSGVKLEGLYEIQITDQRKEGRLTGRDCGGVYPRAELLPRYRYLDDGHAPRVNAARPAGEWQTLDLVFRAPRFDAKGKKVAKARFDKVLLNGMVIHENLELDAPTGHAWRLPEVARGSLMLQADHGPVAFRNVRVRPL
jgi:hypothetical protein